MPLKPRNSPKKRVIRNQAPELLLLAPGRPDWLALGFDAGKGTDEDGQAEREADENRGQLRAALMAAMQMQNVVMLAGSGCSLAVGGPSMTDLWVSAARENSECTVEEVAEQVGYDLKAEGGENVEALLSWIKAYIYIHRDEDKPAAFLLEAEKIILKKCSAFLKGDRLEAHETLLHRLSRRRGRDHRLRIFTTNYDLCFETAASNLGLTVLDGFSFARPRSYDPRFFSYDVVDRSASGDGQTAFVPGVFHLHKLHGSVNWSRTSSGGILEKDQPSGKDACLIYPARDKYQQSYTQPYLESMSQYLAAVRKPNTCVVVAGFGFNDDHLSEPLLAAVRANPSLKVIVVDYSPKEKVENEINYWKDLADLSAAGEDVWLLQADFEAFSKILPDLKSLTPADSLLRAVQKAVKSH